MRRTLVVTLLALTSGTAIAQEKAPLAASLAQISGSEAMGWVTQQNRRTFDTLQSDPRYQGFYDSVLKVEQSPQRLAEPEIRGGRIWNFWQDANHPRGIWRETSFASFLQDVPAWTTRLDVDALARRDHADWVFQGVICAQPEDARCLIALSNGGEDAVTYREFDMHSGQFVLNGFSLSRGKQEVRWLDRDTLLVGRDWAGMGQNLTKSGYAYILKVVRRGAALSDAKEVFRGTKDDVTIMPYVLVDEHGRRVALVQEALTFFDSKFFVLKAGAGGGTSDVRLLALPKRVSVKGLSNGRLVLILLEDWHLPSGNIAAGSVVAVDPEVPDRNPEILLTPSKTQAVDTVAVSRGGVIVTWYDQVQPQAAVYNRTDSGVWQRRSIPLPHNESVDVTAASAQQNEVFFTTEGYIQPPQLWQIDTQSGQAREVKQTQVLFNASGLMVEQDWATSRDGTKIPYFLVHRRDMQLDGRNPTLLTAYGGFDDSYLPTYFADIGQTWLQRGGVYAVANIRGGGEFGPAWHEAGRKSGRQRSYDDFAAVGEDLETRHVTSAAHLGIRGRSNGGLLMGVEFTQHPDLWNAVIIGVPLLDMLHYETMAAGASWADEYGSASNPAELPFLKAISPLQNLKLSVKYPTPFIFTSTKDDRVGPVHARLFAARLQEMGKPFYYYEDTEGGHTGTVNAPEVAHERALEAVYLSRALIDKAPATP